MNSWKFMALPAPGTLFSDSLVCCDAEGGATWGDGYQFQSASYLFNDRSVKRSIQMIIDKQYRLDKLF